MSHNIGRVLTGPGTRIGPDGPTGPVQPGTWEFSFLPGPALSGGTPRFLLLHFGNMDLPGTSRVEVELGYDQDVFTSLNGSDAWTRPVDPAVGPILIRFVGPGPAGGVTLASYGSGEPWQTTHSNAAYNSITNPDLFLHTNPYMEPVYQPWLECGGTFDWQNVTCAAAGSVYEDAARAVGMYVHAYHDPDTGQDLLSSCSGTLIDTNLFLTARHCATDTDELDIRSGSVCFGYQTTCGGGRPAGYGPTFHKVRRVARAGATPTSYTTTTDWLILEIDPPPVAIAPRTLRASNPAVNEPVFAVHHPNGAVKKFQTGTLSSGVVTNVHGFDYAGGSSGSALFDAMGQVIGAALSSGTGGYYQCDVGYCPAPSVIAGLSAPPAPPAPWDLMMVIDRSGSMSEPGTSGPGSTKMDDAREAASLFVQLVRTGAGDRVGMVSFSSTASAMPDTAAAVVTAGQKQLLVGPSPYTAGTVGGLAPGGSTTIGGGLQAALGTLSALPSAGNQRAILLLTDGMENTPPMVAQVEGTLGDTHLCAVGFGAEYALDGALLSRLAADHNGLYTRADDGLSLKKFFGLCFGNIFESGTLLDPVMVFGRHQKNGKELSFPVCDEDQITVVVGWDDPSADVDAVLFTPTGASVTDATPGTTADAGRTWWFLRVPLPINGERQGQWRLLVRRRTHDEDGGSDGSLRCFVQVLADGGPRLVPLRQPGPVYTGDRINPLVALHYPNGTAPRAEIELTVERPDGSLGELVVKSGLRQPQAGEDPAGAFTATLQGLAAQNGGALPLPTATATLSLYDDSFHDDGGMEPDGVYGNPVDDLTRFEGTYTFRAIASYEDPCPGHRETAWAIHVEAGIDSHRTGVEIVDGGRLRIRPRDRYGSPLGPGRADRFGITGQAGTQVETPVIDNGDGSYDVSIEWDNSKAPSPGIVITQPGRDPVTVTVESKPGGTGVPGGEDHPPCRRWSARWLSCLLGGMAGGAVVAAALARRGRH